MAVLMGVLMGTVAALDPISAMFFLSFVIFALITHKINNIAFYIGTVLVFMMPVIRAISDSADYGVNWLILAVLIFSGWIDEEGNKLADSQRLRGAVAKFFDFRFFMKITVFLLAFFSVIPVIYFVAFIAYDLAYLSVAFYSTRLLKKQNKEWLQKRNLS
jgi:hypothetical protein